MVREMGSGSKSESNRLESSAPWLLLWELQVSALERVYLLNNEEPFVYGGATYRPFPISLEQIGENLRGEIPGVNLVVSNITREIQAFLQHRRGLLDRTVILRVVHANYPDEPALRHRFTIYSSSADEKSASFTLSQLPFFQIMLPYRTFQRASCIHSYRGPGCGWAFPTLPPGVQDSTSCSKRMAGPNGCIAHGLLYEAAGVPSQWPGRFGGAPGIPRRRI